ncbi:acyl-CoA dehydrogenase family protein [Thalassobacillus pellis]|uniref:acyl-CoA dehydrogenase family protein n=1 Tax=Thalassobacillus pellis TaxID=748008 RepID=UPI00195F9077|nr:acyl-CoA dehydrogenase family protein [Thalassobacillus pellis]MBM7554218.1 alkylation response protein AidB-like acyl-CoA dehydrogenase [Thalassobacillus pellis]
MNDLYRPFIKNDSHRKYFDKAGQLSSKVKNRADKQDEAAVFSPENLKDLKTARYFSLPLPEEYGGENISLYEFLLMQEKLAEGDGAVALSVGWHLGIVMELRDEQLWDSKMFEKIAQEIASSQKVLNRAASEPATGSPTRGGIPETRAVPQDGKYIINGKKTFTTMADVLDYYVVSAYIEDRDAVGWFLIEKGLSGVQVDHTWDTLGMRGTGSDDLVLTDVEVKADSLVEMADGKKSNPKGWLLHIPACYLGIAIAARNDAIAFAKNFQPNSLDHPISEVGHIKQKIGEMELKLMSARYFMYSVAERWDNEPAERTHMGAELAAVKVVATNAANEVVDLAMRIAGGRGLSKKYPFEKYYRDVRAGLHNPPMDDAVLNMLAART